jgi:uncharacterized iron-regulated protein
MKKFILLIYIIPTLNLTAQLTEKNYRIYSVRLAREVAINDIVDNMLHYDVLFYGEEHNDSVTHYLEYKIFETLHQKFSSSITLSMEMFERDVQPVMNEYLTSEIREKNFRKDARAWSNFKDYRPMIEFCKLNKLDVICANAAGRYSNLAGRKGQNGLIALPEESKKYFAPLPYDTASGKYYEKLTGLFDGSGSKNKKSSTTETFSLVMAQSLWDATMAYSIADYFKYHMGKKIFQINGRFHSDEYLPRSLSLKSTIRILESWLFRPVRMKNFQISTGRNM